LIETTLDIVQFTLHSTPQYFNY